MKAGTVALVLATSAGVPQFALAQDLPVAIDEADLGNLLACFDQASCDEALLDLLALYPGVEISALVGAVAARVAEAYSAGTIAPGTAVALFGSMSRTPGVSTRLVSALKAAATVASNGGTLDLNAIASAAEVSPT